MPKASISELLAASPLMRPYDHDHELIAAREMRVFRDEDGLKGKVQKAARNGQARSGALGAKLSKIISETRGKGRRTRAAGAKTAFDVRQRVIATVAYQKHGAGAGGRLIAHGKYLERDGAGPAGEKGQFYDRDHDSVDATPRLEEWAEEDKRHFRLMLAPESGTRIEDLKDFTRATMARMERDLGAPLDWMAVDHHNTDNPHVHVVLRGRRRDGPDLVLPREYVSYGLRHAARDVATEMLGGRGPEDERLALDRETRSARYTRLDQLLEAEIKPNQEVRIQAIGKTLEPVLRAALRNRVRELARLGLVRDSKRDRFRFEPGWGERLEEIGRGIDIRRRLGRELAPGEGKLKLYRPSMGRFAAEVVEVGARGNGLGKSYAIVRSPEHGPVFINVRSRAVDGIEPGGIIEIDLRRHSGRGNRVRVQSLSALPIAPQVNARAETELDRELARMQAGQSGKLPGTPAVADALNRRIAWHEQEKSGARDLTGRFEFEPGALKRLRDTELLRETNALAKRLGKRALAIDDGLEREWTARGVEMLHQGRVALLERNDGVALAPIAAGQRLTVGKNYSIAVSAGKVKVTPSLGLER